MTLRRTKIRRQKAPKRTQQHSFCTAVIPLKTKTIRSAEMRKMLRNKATYTHLDGLWTVYEEERKDYTTWLHKNCGASISAVNSLKKEFELAQRKLQLTYQFMNYYRHYTKQQCAEAAITYFETEGTIPPGFAAFFGLSNQQDHAKCDDEPKNDHAREIYEDEEDEDWDDGNDEDDIFSFLAHLQEDFDRRMRLANGITDEEVEQKKKTVKQIYRKIARKLHPDHAEVTDAATLNLWHEAHAAYEREDLETLERIYAHCDLIHPDSMKKAQVATLRDGNEFYKKASAQIRSKIRSAKKEPDWGFHSWNSLKIAREKARLEKDFSSLCSELEQNKSRIEYRLAQWTKRPTPKNAPQNLKRWIRASSYLIFFDQGS